MKKYLLSNSVNFIGLLIGVYFHFLFAALRLNNKDSLSFLEIFVGSFIYTMSFIFDDILLQFLGLVFINLVLSFTIYQSSISLKEKLSIESVTIILLLLVYFWINKSGAFLHLIAIFIFTQLVRYKNLKKYFKTL